MDDYRRIAQAIADDMTAGRLLPGDRLPPQRVFAHQRGIAAWGSRTTFAESSGKDYRLISITCFDLRN
jgi:DNA-binding transcriptional regulator YhcF (GntR family)